mmetsp:Transcript_41491/g.123987  ORF Transcript_41491/g.123987 Transcript_41491/m.123987 type:complete len:364 (-) Transcript_41491:2233-3324(-)
MTAMRTDGSLSARFRYSRLASSIATSSNGSFTSRTCRPPPPASSILNLANGSTVALICFSLRPASVSSAATAATTWSFTSAANVLVFASNAPCSASSVFSCQPTKRSATYTSPCTTLPAGSGGPFFFLGGASALATSLRIDTIWSSMYFDARCITKSGVSVFGHPAVSTEPSFLSTLTQMWSEVWGMMGASSCADASMYRSTTSLDMPSAPAVAKRYVSRALPRSYAALLSASRKSIFSYASRARTHAMLTSLSMILSCSVSSAPGARNPAPSASTSSIHASSLVMRKMAALAVLVSKLASSIVSPASASAQRIASAENSSMDCLSVLKLPVDFAIFALLRSRWPLVRNARGQCSRGKTAVCV